MISEYSHTRWVFIILGLFLLIIAVSIGIMIPKVNILIPLVISLIIPITVIFTHDLANFKEHRKSSKVIILLMVSFALLQFIPGLARGFNLAIY